MKKECKLCQGTGFVGSTTTEGEDETCPHVEEERLEREGEAAFEDKRGN